jgi:chromosome segregation ATPase
MGATKLSSSKSSDSLKAFDSRLKKALTSKRILNALRHKVDSGIITLRNKRAIILRLKTQVADELTASTKRANDARNHEDSLRKSIQDEKYETKNIIEDITSARSEVTGLGQDLANNHITLEDTKSRAECTMSDLVAEDKRHDSFMKQEYSKLEAYKKQEAEKKAREQEVLKEIELKRTQLLQSWKRCVQLQQEEGHELSPEPTEDAATPTLDVDKLQAVLDEEQAALLSDKTKRDDVNKSLTAAREEVASLESKDTAVLEEMESTTNATDDAQKVENDRKKANSKFLDELEKDRYSVRDLRRSVSELEESIGSERKRLDDRYAEQSEMIEKRQTEVEESKAELADALTTHQDLEGRFEEKQKSDSRLLEKAKREADSTRSDFEEARLQVEALKNAPDTDIQKEVEDIQQAQSILVEDTKDEIEQLCEGKCVVVLLCTLPTVSIRF